MLTYSGLGTKGRLGNQLFQIASVTALGKKHGHDVVFPEWKYQKYFETQFSVGNLPGAEVLKEQSYTFHEWAICKAVYDDGYPVVELGYDLTGWLQSELYWKGILDPKQLFKFRADFIKSVAEKSTGIKIKATWENPSDKTIAISVRRGDFVTNPNYYTLDAMYYFQALLEHFPDWRDYNLLFFSDDISYCKVHFECLPNALFAEGLTDIEQLCLMSSCDHFIVSNSTFSWWGAYLGEKKGTKVIRPNYLFDGNLLKHHDDSTYWPERWIVFDHVGKKIDLSDVTFTIPVKFDHNDRKQNISLCLCLLQRQFNANFIIGEQGGNVFKHLEGSAKYMPFDYDKFHRTRMLNEMAKAAETEFIVNWDADVICPPVQIYMAVEALRKGCDMVYPYDGSFARMPRNWFRAIEKLLDIGIVGDTQFKGKRGGPMPTSSVGGAVLFNKDSFIEGGMENEYMISYAPEDCERYDRFNMLGFKVERIEGTIYHLDHFVGPDSTSKNPLFKSNKAELEKIRVMNQKQLWEYVSTWPWLGDYNGAYYNSISEDSSRSAERIYWHLEQMGIRPKTVIDVGCGIGHWSKGCPGEYIGIDHNIPKHKLLITSNQFFDADLKRINDYGTILRKKPDLVLCLEVLEHLPEEKADAVIKFLCSIGDLILFSAAIPNQGGVGHINEQWQTWWAKKFAEYGFYPSNEQLRERIYDHNEICVWYRQNIVLYEKGGKGSITDFVHPEMWMNVAGKKTA